MSVYTYDLATSNAQLDEMEKIALSPAGTAWAGRLIGAGVGAAAGGLAGRATAEPDQKALGTVRGAMLGAGAGLLGGQFATKAGLGQAQRFGQRQLHSMTGYLPGRGLLGRAEKGSAKWYQLGTPAKKQHLLGAPIESMTSGQRVSALKEMGWHVPEQATKKGIREAAEKETREGKVTGLLPKRVQEFLTNRRTAARVAQRRIAEEGMTSVPGLVRGYMGKSPGKISPLEAARLNLAAPGVAMGVGIPLTMTAQSAGEYAQTGDEAALARGLASNVGYAAGAGLPMLAAMGLGSAAGGAGELVGRGVQRLRGKTPGQLVPAEG